MYYFSSTNKNTGTIRTQKKKTGVFTLLCLMFFPLLVSACKKEQPAQPVQEVDNGKPVMRIAFVGDAFSETFDIPGMIKAIAKSDPSCNFNIEVGSLMLKDNSLAQLWKGDPKKTLFDKTWDYMVLKPQPLWASSDGSIYPTQKALSAWILLADQKHIEPVFFMTWPLATGNAVYSDPQYAFSLKNYKNMHHMTHGYSKALSKKNKLLLLPVGDYWVYIMDNAPGLNLYAEDGATPSAEGAFLTALIIYKKLVDSTLNDIKYMPDNLDEETRDALIAVASMKLEE